MLLSIPAFCKAEVYLRFANIVCLENSGFFEVFGTGIYDIEKYSREDNVVKEIESTSNLVYGRDIVKKSCKLHGGLFEVKLEYTSASEAGRCMGNPGASLTLMKNGKVLIDGVSFDWSCDGTDIKKLTVNSGQFVEICGNHPSIGSNLQIAFCITDFDFPKDGTPVSDNFIRETIESKIKKSQNVK